MSNSKPLLFWKQMALKATYISLKVDDYFLRICLMIQRYGYFEIVCSNLGQT